MRIGIVFCLLLATRAFGQWLPDQRLTDSVGDSKTSWNPARNVAAESRTVHVVWYDDRELGGQMSKVYYKRSIDDGVKWGEDIRFTPHYGWRNCPSVTASGANVHAVWYDGRDGNEEIYYKRSTDDGENWDEDIRLTDDAARSCYPVVAAAGSNIHVVWHDGRNHPGNSFFVWYKRSTDNGATWGTDTKLTTGTGNAICPSVATSGANVHVVSAYVGQGYELRYRRSTDNGETWDLDLQITNTPNSITDLCDFAVAGDTIHVLWQDDVGRGPGDYRVYYKRSTDNGATWGNDTCLVTPSKCYEASVAVAGSNVHVAWCDTRDGNREIYYKYSTDNGMTWSRDTALTSDPADSHYPKIAVAGTHIHVVWHDYRDGNYEIYHKRNPTGNVAVGEPGPRGPCGALRITPNPVATGFATVRFSLPKAGPVAVTVFDVAGRCLITRPLGHLATGSLPLDVRKLTAGVYLVRLDAGGYSATQKLVVQCKNSRNQTIRRKDAGN